MAVEEIDFTYIIREIRTGWVSVAAFSMVGALMALAASFLVTPIYRAETVVAEVRSDEELGGLAAITGQLGGLAATAGLLPGSSEAGDEAIAILKSRIFTTKFITDHNIAPILFAEKWDSTAKQWKVSRPEDIPTSQDAFEEFHENVRKISRDPETGLVTLSVMWSSPVLAARWANDLISDLNQEIREREIAEARKSMEYLRSELERTSILEVRAGIYRMMENQIKRIMLANVRDEYAFRVIDPAVPPDSDDPISPNRPMYAALGLVAGLLSGLTKVLARPGVRNRPRGGSSLDMGSFS